VLTPPFEPDPDPVELGLRFSSEQAGFITGVRFFKHALNNGEHTGSLWSAGGTLLATGVFTNETASGWQELAFSSPVEIAANTVYVASYHTATGYAQNPNEFTGAGVDNPPLHAPADGAGGRNGVYVYGASAFPSEGYQGSNYFVDVVFATSSGPDLTPPSVVSVSPESGATEVGVSSTVSVTFSEAMDPASVSGATFQLRDPRGTLMPATVECETGSLTATLTPTAPLARSTTYTVRIAGGTLDPTAKDVAGNRLAADYTWSFTTAQTVEPAGWYSGDMHAHRSCSGPPESVQSIYDAMVEQDLSVVSLLADMGSGDVLDPVTDLPRVTGQDDPLSTPGRILHWDAEWHWDASYDWNPHQALGGHIVALGLSEAHQIWEEYTYPIFQWAHQQGALAGFVHMEYLGNGFPQTLDCCIPVEYPVEVALGAADFIAEDVWFNDTAIDAYYRLLNCGFRPSLAAGSDHPCAADVGPLVTYAQVAGGQLTYRGWIDAIAAGRTVVSRVGRSQFLDVRVNGTATPGDEIRLTGSGNVHVSARWTTNQYLARTIELVSNGVVVASKATAASPGSPDSVTATIHFTKSGWICARVMGSGAHEVHTAAVFVTVNGAPVRASASDAQFYVDWIDQLIAKTSPGGEWNWFFPTSLAEAQERYRTAKFIYEQIAAGVTAVGPAAGSPDDRLSLGVTPNPAVGPLRADFTLPAAGRAVLEIMDITGRRVAAREVGSLGPGRHQVTMHESLAPGVYLVRIIQGNQARVRRVVLLD
jgi:hypothetical protein